MIRLLALGATGRRPWSCAPRAFSNYASPTPYERLQRLLTGHWVSQAIFSINRKRIPDLLAKQALTVPELARATQSNQDALYRILRVLAAEGLFKETRTSSSDPASPSGKWDHIRFELTPLGHILRTDHPNSMHGAARVYSKKQFLLWDSLDHSLHTGKEAFSHRFGAPLFEHMATDDDTRADFHAGMGSLGVSIFSNSRIVNGYDFGVITAPRVDKMPTVIADIGGGEGSFLEAVLSAPTTHPTTKGILFDRGEVVPAQGSTRMTGVSGDFFESVPVADVYVLKRVIHDWDDEKCQLILKNCLKSLRPSTTRHAHDLSSKHGARAAATNPAVTDLRRGTLLIFETCISDKDEDVNAPYYGKNLDLNMLALTGGRERTEGDFQALLASSGWHMTRVIRIPECPMCVIEAVPAVSAALVVGAAGGSRR